MIAWVESILLITGACVAWLTHKRRTRAAFLLVLAVSYTALTLFSLYLDIPDSVAPRTSHLYLLVLSLASLLVFKHESRALRWFLTSVLMLTFLLFASTVLGALRLNSPFLRPFASRVSGSTLLQPWSAFWRWSTSC